MSMIKNIEIDGKQVPFRASAAIPRIYRMKFQRDIYKDLASLEKAIDSNTEEVSNLDLFSLEMFENIAYVMAKHADPNIPDTPEEKQKRKQLLEEIKNSNVDLTKWPKEKLQRLEMFYEEEIKKIDLELEELEERV